MKTTILSLIFLLLGSKSYASQDDVYNFYFQKAPGPQKVVQGGESTGVTQSQSSVIKNEIKHPLDKYKWEIMLSNAMVSYSYSGVGVSARRLFNRFFSLDAGLLYANSRDVFDYAPAERKGLQAFDGYLGGSLTPIHAKIFDSYIFEVGFLIGVMTVEDVQWQYHSDVHGNTYDRTKKYGQKYISSFAGWSMAANFTEQFGFVMKARGNGDGKFQSNIGLRYRF